MKRTVSPSGGSISAGIRRPRPLRQRFPSCRFLALTATADGEAPARQDIVRLLD
ncbi:hypothetical protein ACVXG7_04280 [Enterobacter hormaechei]